MGIDFDIALRAHHQIEQTVAPEGIEHMVEKRHARRNIASARAVKVELYHDIGFARFARNLSNSSHGQLLSKRLESTLYQPNDSCEQNTAAASAFSAPADETYGVRKDMHCASRRAYSWHESISSFSNAANAANTSSFSSGVPTVMRRQLAKPGA